MRRAISWVTWLPKSRIRTRSVMRRASFSFPFLRASPDQIADLGPAIGDFGDGGIGDLPFRLRDQLPAQPVVETAEGIELEGPEAEVLVTLSREPGGELPQDPPADPAAVARRRDIEAVDLGCVGIGVALDDHLVAQRRAAAGDREDGLGFGGDQMHRARDGGGQPLLPL